MKWIDGISEAIEYIESNITEPLTIEAIAKCAFISPFYFQKGFAMLCGFTVSEYIRLRRLTLAGSELLATEDKIIDIAMKYGYDSPDSFTKAFTRFHGVTPTAVRKDGAMIKSYAPLKIKFSLEGGFIMDYKIVDKEEFTVMGALKEFQYEGAFTEIPQFWKDHFSSGGGQYVCGMFCLSIDEDVKSERFEYMIADIYDATKDVPEGFVTKQIPKHTWAIFPCLGGLPKSLQDVNQKIFSEWLPNCKEYEIAAGYNVEMYSNADDYPNGTQDDQYYCEIWIPVKKK